MNTAKGAEELLKKLKNQTVSRSYIIQQLSEFCIGWPYVFGAAGEMCTPGNRKKFAGYHPEYQSKIYNACPFLSGKQPSCQECKWSDCRIFDCRGFTRWLVSQTGLYLHGGGATTQWETESNWVAKGDINNIPFDLVCCVFKRKEGKMSHTGMYQGGGKIIHCSTVVKEDILSGTPAWTHWAMPAGLYTAEELRRAGVNVSEDKNTPTLRRGSTGEEVEELQAILNAKYGYDLEIDGVFGKSTETVVKDFQKKHNLTVDGIVGPKTWKALGVFPEQDTNHNNITINGNNNIVNELPSNEKLPEHITISIPLEEWRTLRAATATIQYIMKKHENV